MEMSNKVKRCTPDTIQQQYDINIDYSVFLRLKFNTMP